MSLIRTHSLTRIVTVGALLFALASPAWASGAPALSGEDARTPKPESPAVSSGAALGPSAEATTSVVVGFEPAESAQAIDAATALGAKVTKRGKSGALAVVRVPDGVDVDEFCAELSARPGVEYAEPDVIVRATLVPDDPLMSEAWGIGKIGSYSAWDVTRGSGVVVAVLDTGVLATHEDLVGRVDTVNDYDFENRDSNATDDSTSGHGTHVAGVIAATLNNGVGVAGVANQATILPMKVLDATGTGEASVVAEAVRYAADHGAKVINMSLASATQSSALADACLYAAREKDVVVCGAVGNDGLNSVYYPGASTEVLGVGSTEADDRLSLFSNYGVPVDFTAPGRSIKSTMNTGLYAAKSGTSMAAPHVAGVAALIRAKNPAWTRPMVEQQLAATALDLGSAGKDSFYGFGRVRADIAVGPGAPVNDDNIASAVVPSGSPIVGTVDSSVDKNDVYRIHVEAGRTLTVNMTGAPGQNFDIYLYATDASDIWADELSGKLLAKSNDASNSEKLRSPALPAGDYFLRVYANSGRGAYEVTPIAEVRPYTWMPVYRFFNTKNGSHFYTASQSEKVSVLAKLSKTYSLDGVAYSVNTSDPENSSPLYRFYNKKNGSHFYTADTAERDRLLNTMGATYSYDGPAYNVSLTKASYARTVYRFFNKKNGSHFYTASESEKASVLANLGKTYSLDGAAFYLAE